MRRDQAQLGRRTRPDRATGAAWGTRRRAGLALEAIGAEALEARVLLAFDPTPNEQFLLELLNRMRADPQGELDRLTTSLGTPARASDPDVDSALRFFNVSGPELEEQWAPIVAAPPLAWHEDLYEAAEFHTEAMIEANEQTHQASGEPGLGDRARNAGYTGFSTLGENVYAFARGVIHSHAGFALDWGNGPGGIQDPAGHRDSMMNANFREVGIRMLAESNNATQVGPWLVTQDFGNRFSFGNAYLLGVVYEDRGAEGYGAGEGLGGVVVQIEGSNGTFQTTTMSAGAYQLQVPPGVYDITFSGGDFGDGARYSNVTVGGQNVKLDGVKGFTPPTPDIVILSGDGGDDSIAIVTGDRMPTALDGTDFGRVNMAQTLIRLFTIRNDGDAPLQLAGLPRVVISGPGFSRYSLVSDAAGLLGPGESTTFQVLFDPADTLLKNADITIVSDDPDEPTYTFRIKARGEIAPDITLTAPQGIPIVDGDTSPTNADGTGFGSVNIVQRSKVRTFTIRNDGSSTLTLSEQAGGGLVRIVGLNASDFSIVTQPEASVAPGSSTSFRVRFNPSASGVRSATVRIASNDADEGTFDFAIRGVGTLAPIIRVVGLGLNISATSPPSVTHATLFADQPVSGGRRLHTFTIFNIGSAAMDFTLSASTRVSVVGADAVDFEITRQPARRIEVGQSAIFRVRFDPDALGLRSAIVRIDTLNAGSFEFSIAGVGV